MQSFTNQAQLIYNDTVTNSNIVTGTLIDLISADKTAVNTAYTRGTVVTYVISITNSGSTAYNDLRITDDLGAYEYQNLTVVPLDYVGNSVKYYRGGILQPSPTILADGGRLSITGISVPAGGSSAVIYQARVNDFAPLELNSTIENTATITGEGIATPVVAVEKITVDNSAIFTITKSISQSSITPNSPITYTFIIQNTGNVATDSTSNIFVTDMFRPLLDNLTAELNGTPLTIDTEYTYSLADGIFTTVPGVITVPAATYIRDAATGVVTVNPGSTVLTVSGNIV